MAKIYVSSTFLDLRDYRIEVERVIRRMGHEDVAMEYYVAEDQRPVARCLADVGACDVYVGIFGWRYGWQPVDNNPAEYSITELEYRQADEAGKPCLIFLVSDDAPWPKKFIDRDTARIEKLRNAAAAMHTADHFKTPDELARKVAEAIHKSEKEDGLISGSASVSFDARAYYLALRQRYGVLALEGLTPPQKEEFLKIQLQSVFVEQSVRENPPPVELPKEVWEKLSREKEIHPEDLPPGITLLDVSRARKAYYEQPSHPVLDVITSFRYQHIVIIGDPGSGKSTLARYVVLSLIDSAGETKLRQEFEGYLPLLIELRTYAALWEEGKCNTPLEYLEFLGKTEGWHLTQAALDNHLKSDGRTVVIFDGLDEIFEPDKREQITRQIVGFCSDYTKARVIVTSRVLGYRRKILTDAGFAHFALQDLGEEQVSTFVNRWYDLAMSDRLDEAKERRERILKSFKESMSIRQLAGNPMLLTILAIIGKHQDLPRERWKLYDHAASVLIQHWDVNKHLRDRRVEFDFIGEDDKKELLRRLAFRMQSGAGGLAGNYIPREGLQAELENYLRKRYAQKPDRAKVIAEAMIRQFRERNFILSLYGANLYGFVHRAFLEYFCASAFVHRFERTRELTIDRLKSEVYGSHWEEQSWHEVLRLICGMIDVKFAGEIIEYLLSKARPSKKRTDDHEIPWNLVLAFQCAGEIRNREPLRTLIERMVENAFASLEHIILKERINPLFFEDYIFPASLEFNDSLVSIKVIIRRIRRICRPDDPESHGFFIFRRSLLSTCGQMIGLLAVKSESNRKAVVSLLKAGYPLLKMIAIKGLAKGWPNHPETLALLRSNASSDRSAAVRGTALETIIADFRAGEDIAGLLFERVEHDEEADNRVMAIDALLTHFNQDARTRPMLHAVIMNDPSGPVRLMAIRKLMKEPSEQSNLLPLLYDLADKDPYKWLRFAVVAALCEYHLQSPMVLELMYSRAREESETDIRIVIIESLLLRFPDSARTLSLLHAILSDDWDNTIRLGAIDAIAHSFASDPQTVPLVCFLAANDIDPWIRLKAVEVLGRRFSGVSEVLPVLQQRCWSDVSEDVREAARRAIRTYSQ